MRNLRFLLAAAAVALLAAPAPAQQDGGCVATSLDDPPRQAWDCGNGLLIEAEAGLLIDQASPPGAATAEEGAVLVEAPPGGDFQIRTPHAIASVRGTVFVVDVDARASSVFVVEGVVEVARRDGGETVMLAAGEGVDVAEGAPLAAQRWQAARVEALLARFGR